MTAVLRRAASLMRERAEMVLADCDSLSHEGSLDRLRLFTIETHAQHIASWHPAVALAVADWLAAAGADLWAHGLHCADGCMECDDDLWAPHVRRALAVARAYLGEVA